ncbi:trigger factor [Proteiniclasticum sp. SCR006]|uniref:Trigger factor n=1 Tax=Proteiniclasticum aestuarii TaxID=2817862 RepID=A0A939H6W1_9CLOT|nr:trigger factor [Proteiniclasticum aestuarii]MBO1264231.1 trigger factor [Proteiniclasticum aestuarii]
MNVKHEKLDSKKVKLEVTLEAAKLDEAIRKSYKKNVKNLNVQGFRKGKAPLALVKQFYGVEVLFDDASDFLLSDSYPKAIEEADIKPIDYPKIDITQMEEGKDFVYTAEVEVYPEFDLPEYKGLEVEKPVIKVTDHDIDHEIEHLVERNGRIESKPEGAVVEKDDVAVINFNGKVDGVEFEGGKGENFELTIGANMFIGDFEDQLIGLKVGEEKTVKVTFPEDYQAEELKGKDAEFDVEILDIKTKEFPEVDDEFASEVSEFETLEELKASIREGLEEDANSRAKSELNNNLIKALAEKAEIDVPEVMVETSIDRLVRDFEQRIQQQGISKEMYLQMTGQEESAIREMFRDNAKNVVKNDLLIEAIVAKEGIEATEEEVMAKAEEIVKMYGEQQDELKEMLLTSNRRDLEMEVTTNKVFDLLLESAKVTEKEISVSHDHSHDDHNHEEEDHEGHDHE